MKSKFILSAKSASPFQTRRLAKGVMIITLVLPHFATAQPDSMPEGSSFFEEYTVEEQVHFLLPDETSIEQMTEWDWIEMEPTREVRKHRKIMNADLQHSERVDILEANPVESWEHDIDYILIEPEELIIYDREGQVVSSLPHSDYYLASSDSLRMSILDNGFKPQLPFPPFEELPVDDIEAAGYSVTEIDLGYIIANDSEEISINVEKQTRIYQLLYEEYNIPFYDFQDYNISAQGYRVPSVKRSKTRTLSENGHCIISVKNETFSNYEIYYDPALLYEDEEEADLSSDFTVYPNPTETSVEIEYTGDTFLETAYNVSISNQMGEPFLTTYDFNTSLAEAIDVSDLPQGLYLLHFTIEGNHFTKTILKE